ncbi:hypothetical protein QK292_11020 [Arthrobacter sp. AL08]|uniref:hypothetical protein n=1 Tax=Micrococcaceae TaxID=1268 RepID=UPI001CFF6FD3|nr:MULTISPECIES: hypothetical protein [Micrococcaceae]MDI3241958.1 hypothetical protein [Arthrobacter sp. AL05]MDI3278102.1 hypothetical protein [Arthrobacter sp. AL08]MDJ0354191.1 hypothetical protein [Pseudarthrobacter sp. PH31-O2]WGZ79292.1 hypothetical protein QI450_15830 [Arthrobacter sp. EM1]
MAKFRGWHIVAGIAAMVLTGILGNAMGLNYTADFMASCVAFVAVSMWMDSRISRRRGRAARASAAAADGGPGPESEHPAEAERPEREGRGS